MKITKWASTSTLNLTGRESKQRFWPPFPLGILRIKWHLNGNSEVIIRCKKPGEPGLKCRKMRVGLGNPEYCWGRSRTSWRQEGQLDPNHHGVKSQNFLHRTLVRAQLQGGPTVLGEGWFRKPKKETKTALDAVGQTPRQALGVRRDDGNSHEKASLQSGHSVPFHYPKKSGLFPFFKGS